MPKHKDGLPDRGVGEYGNTSALIASERKVGDTWINLISGLEYRWDGKQWVSTNKYPYSANPMGFLGDGTQ